MAPGRVYLDHAATTPLRPEAGEALLAVLEGPFGNPSGGHDEARQARRALEDARDTVTDLLGVAPGEVVFTSGGTESDNLALLGGWDRTTPEVVCAAFEHPAVLEACRALHQERGAPLVEVPARADGVVDLEALSEACTPATGLVSVMAVNNEVGTVQPLAEVAARVRRQAPKAVLHTDAVQAAPWMDLTALATSVDLLTLSGHKFGGPKGSGVLMVRGGRRLSPQLHGGGQERERRSGTQNVAGAVALAAALSATVAERVAVGRQVGALRARLRGGLIAQVPGLEVSGDTATTVPGILHVRVAGVEAEALVALLDEEGIAVSAGAACSSGAVEPSHVLLAMSVDRVGAASGIRLSLGRTTTAAEIDRALEVVPAAITRLRD